MNGLMAEAAAAGRCTDKVTPLYYLITTRLTHSFSVVLKARVAVGDATLSCTSHLRDAVCFSE